METCLNSDIRSIQVIVITLIVKIGPCGIILGVFQIILNTSPRKHSLWTQTYFRSSLLSTREWIQVERSDRKWKYVCVRQLKETQVICKVIWGIPVVLVFSYNYLDLFAFKLYLGYDPKDYMEPKLYKPYSKCMCKILDTE